MFEGLHCPQVQRFENFTPVSSVLYGSPHTCIKPRILLFYLVESEFSTVPLPRCLSNNIRGKCTPPLSNVTRGRRLVLSRTEPFLAYSARQQNRCTVSISHCRFISSPWYYTGRRSRVLDVAITTVQQSTTVPYGDCLTVVPEILHRPPHENGLHDEIQQPDRQRGLSR